MKIAIFGTGGHGREVLEYLCPKAVFIDDNKNPGTRINGRPVVGGKTLLADRGFLHDYEIIIALGDNKLRGELSRTVLKHGGTLAIAIHASAIFSTHSTIGAGSVVMPYAIVGPNVKIGKYCIINKAARISHDAYLKDGVNISDDATLTTTVGEEAFIGLHVAVIPRVAIGARAIVGAGAVVTKEVLPDTTVAGVPARVIAKRGTHG